MSAQTYSGVVAEVGGPELGSTGKEKPRKIIIKTDPTQQYGKTFRLWSNSYEWEQLQDKLGQQVTVEFVAEERQGPQGSYTQNLITDVLQDVGGNGERTGAVGEVASAPQPSPSDDWTAPKVGVGAPVESPPAMAAPAPAPSSPSLSKDEYWQRREALDAERTLEIEAAWGIGQAIALGHTDPSKIEELTHQLIILKHKIAGELKT